MNPAEALAVVLVFAPMVGALGCLLAGRGRVLATVAVTSVVLSVSAISLLLYMAYNSFSVITIDASSLYPLGPALIITDLGLGALFTYIGWRRGSLAIIAVAVMNLMLAFLLDYQLGFSEASPVILIDNLSLVLILISSLLGPLIAAYALRYMRDDPRQPRFFAVTLLFLGGMNGAVMSNDMLWLYLFWDVTTLCSFLLIEHTGTEEARRAAKRALLITLGGGITLVGGTILAFHYYGTTSMEAIPMAGMEGLAAMPLALLAVAAFTKSAQLPFQSWLLGAMVAPTPVSALLHSATMVNLGVYLLLRTSPSLSSVPQLGTVVAILGGTTFLVSSLLAITQSNAKRVLAWSTVGNLGLIVTCAGIASPLAIAAGLILLFYHSISKALMFLAVGAAKERLGSEDIEAMQGIRATMPFVTLALFVGVFTLVLPPFGMFASKWLISVAATSVPPLIFLLAIGYASIVVVFIKWIGTALSAGPGVRAVPLKSDPLSLNYRWVLGTLILGAVILSALIGLVLRYLVAPFVSRFYDLPWDVGDLSVVIGTGSFPAVLFVMLTLITFAGLLLLVRPSPRERVAKVYAGGEEYVLTSRSNYYLGEGGVERTVALSQVAGALLVGALIVLPFLLEVW